MIGRYAKQAAFIARTDLAHMLRAKETLLWTFVMPILFFFFIGTVTGGKGGAPDADARDPIELRAPEQAGFLLDELVRRLEAERFEVRRASGTESGAETLGRLLVPDPAAPHASFTDALLAGEPSVLRWRSAGEGLDSAYERVRVGRAVYGLLADLAAASASGAAIAPERFEELRRAPRSISIDERPAGARREIPSGFEQAIPGTLVMFTMLVLLTSGAILLVIERQSGLLRRLASTPMSRGAIVTGKWAGKMALGLVQVSFAALAGSLLFGMRWGDSLPAVALLLFAWAAFNASLGIYLGNLARSEAQMAGIGVISSMVLAALGGCWWPIEITPRWMQGLAALLPTGWAMNAMHALVSFGRGPLAALPAVALLLGCALVLGWAAARRFRFQ